MHDSFGHPIIIRRRRGLRQLRIAVAHDGQVTVTAAKLVPLFLVKRFVSRQREWIRLAQERFQKAGHQSKLSPEEKKARFLEYRDAARVLVHTRVDYFAKQFGFAPGLITIRDQRTRWGSCSGSGALSFNYRIVFLSNRLADYIVAHELCHLRELNHGPRFWGLLEEILPDAIDRRKELRAYPLLDTGGYGGTL